MTDPDHATAMPDTLLRTPVPDRVSPPVSLSAPVTAPIARATTDVYRFKHKAVRHSCCRMLMQLGSAGWEDALESAGIIADLQSLLDFIRRHMAQEEEVIHAALDRRVPGACRTITVHHRRFQARTREIGVLVAEMARGGDAQRAEIGHRIYLTFAALAGEAMVAMHEEEAMLLPVLQQTFTDGELRAMEERIFDTIPLDLILGGYRRMIPALNPTERAEMLRGLRHGLSAEAFLSVLERAARPALSPQEWRDVLNRLGLKHAA